MKALIKSWWRRFDCYSFWDDCEYENGDTKPLINFSLESWLVETRPAAYYDYNDTDRWRSVHFRMYISRRLFAISIPYKKLPDYIPNEKSMLRTRKIQKEHNEKLNGITKL